MDKAKRLFGLATIVESDDIKQQLKDAGVELDSHESDLYALLTPESEKIIAGYANKDSVKKFKSEKDGKMWFDIPFADTDYWAEKPGISK
jgi:hypothetical protein